MVTLGDCIARLCLEHFQALPKTGKPNAAREWTVLAAFVMEDIGEADEKRSTVRGEAEKGNPRLSTPTKDGSRDTDGEEHMHVPGHLRVVAMATGSKCLGYEKLDREGLLIQDSHAEVLARRSFQRHSFLTFTPSLTNMHCLLSFSLPFSDSLLSLPSAKRSFIPFGALLSQRNFPNPVPSPRFLYGELELILNNTTSVVFESLKDNEESTRTHPDNETSNDPCGTKEFIQAIARMRRNVKFHFYVSQAPCEGGKDTHIMQQCFYLYIYIYMS